MDSQRPAKDEAILTSVAESIGATLGTIAAKAGSVQKTLAEKVGVTKPRARARKTVSKRPTKRAASQMRRGRTSARRTHSTKKKS
jgi:hypothetical protein